MSKSHSCRITRIAFWIALVFALAACRGPAPAPVSPVTGMPEGTDGYPWWNDTIFYELFVRSFYDSDGDGIGDINGVIEKLDYLNDGDPETTSDLGVTGLWLMPIFPSPSYHGYDVTDFYEINPQYGTLDDFKRLLEEAHKRGIRVTIDLVINHTSSAHPWFIESQDPASPKRDWYVWSETSPGFSGPWGQQVWYKLGEAYYYAVFWEGMPDLNMTNPEVVAEINKVAAFWLELGVDGFRLDAAKHIVEEGEVQENTELTHEFWEQFRTAYKSVNPKAMTVGEVWSATDQVKRYLEGDELDLAFEFDLAGAILSGVNSGSPFITRAALSKVARSFENLEFGVFLANHDQNRVSSQLIFSEDKPRLAASVLLTAPGVPFLYYGEEIGMSGAKPDENIRTPFHWNAEKNAGFTSADFPWRLVNQEYTERNVAAMADDPDSLLSHYRNLIHLRNQHAALRVGRYIEVESDQSNVLVFLRVSQEEQILVVLNFSERPLAELSLSLRAGPLEGAYTPVTLYAPGLWEVGSALPALSASESGGFMDYTPLGEGEALPGLGVAVIQLQVK
jgi:alpha-amylase